jgi:hypothetical protein
MEPVRAFFESSLKTRDDDDNDENDNKTMINMLGGCRYCFWYYTHVEKLLTVLEHWQAVQAVVGCCRSICYFPICWNQGGERCKVLETYH